MHLESADQARLLDAAPPRPVMGIEAFTDNLVNAILKALITVKADQTSPET